MAASNTDLRFSRHSAASYHLAAHRNESLTQSMLGHESGDMLFKNYRELVQPREAEAYWRIVPTKKINTCNSMRRNQ